MGGKLCGWAFRDWSKGGGWRVAVESGLCGLFYPGYSHSKVMGSGIHADAPAVVDDFGNLVIVGCWS